MRTFVSGAFYQFKLDEKDRYLIIRLSDNILIGFAYAGEELITITKDIPMSTPELKELIEKVRFLHDTWAVVSLIQEYVETDHDLNAYDWIQQQGVNERHLTLFVERVQQLKHKF